MSKIALLMTLVGTVVACAASLNDGQHSVPVTLAIALAAVLLIAGAAIQSYADERAHSDH